MGMFFVPSARREPSKGKGMAPPNIGMFFAPSARREPLNKRPSLGPAKKQAQRFDFQVTHGRVLSPTWEKRARGARRKARKTKERQATRGIPRLSVLKFLVNECYAFSIMYLHELLIKNNYVNVVHIVIRIFNN